MVRVIRFAPMFAIVLTALSLAGDQAADQKAAQRVALAKFNGLIGGWRGTGQPRRGSSSGAWQEKADWVWYLKDGVVALDYSIDGGKLLKSGRLTCDPQTGVYRLVAVTPDDQERTYVGKLEDDKLVLVASPGDDATAEAEVYRLTITPLNDLRTLVLHEKRKPAVDTFTRVAEVGYTRAGARLARAGGGQPECVVTGGLGTINVEFQGKKYVVCCTGCKQAFEDDPAGILAEYAERLAKEKAR